MSERASADDVALVGRTIAGKFAIEAFVGKGAMGAVYRARQVALDKVVAIKVMHADMVGDALFATRFQREAKAASRLDHPNSMRVLDFGEDHGLLYIAMEYVDGRDLHRVLHESGPMSEARIVDIVMQILAALAVAHDMGVVHRDLKPENVMIVEGRDDEGRARDLVKVCDFGIAKLDSRTVGDTGAKLSTNGLVVGTPEYMSPEQGKGEPLDGRTDVYSVGVLLFQLLTGRLPFEAESALGIVLKHVTEAPPRPSALVPSIEPRLEAICLRALEKRREDRYASARDMRADLKALVDVADASAPVRAPGHKIIPAVLDRAPTLEVQSQPAALRLAPPPASATVEVPELSPAPVPARPRSKVALVGVGAVLTFASGVIALAALRHGGASDALVVDAATAVLDATDAAPVEDAAPAPSALPAPPRRIAPTRADASLPSADATAPLPPAASASVAAAHPVDGGLAPPAAVTPIDPSKADVTFEILSLDHVRKGPVSAVVREADLAKCYRDALRPDSKVQPGSGTLTLDIDASGHVALAGLEATNVPNAAASCIVNALKGRDVVNVREPATAKLSLAFKPRPTP